MSSNAAEAPTATAKNQKPNRPLLLSCSAAAPPPKYKQAPPCIRTPHSRSTLQPPLPPSVRVSRRTATAAAPRSHRTETNPKTAHSCCACASPAAAAVTQTRDPRRRPTGSVGLLHSLQPQPTPQNPARKAQETISTLTNKVQPAAAAAEPCCCLLAGTRMHTHMPHQDQQPSLTPRRIELQTQQRGAFLTAAARCHAAAAAAASNPRGTTRPTSRRRAPRCCCVRPRALLDVTVVRAASWCQADAEHVPDLCHALDALE